ncbi:acyltransferase domain-containing protein [Streptomyces violascens]|uniref:acyltransferase domain-containing protein n=1 Tax=Streptomyces violascens TaxID=67381 RepID=UPI003653B67E
MDASEALSPVLLFPGEGGYDGTALNRAHHGYPQIRAVFERIDAVTVELFSRKISEIVLDTRPLELPELLQGEPWVAQLAAYGAGLAAHRVLNEHAVHPSAMMGYGLGEITALVAAGAYSIEDGARIVARRTESFTEHGIGGRKTAVLSASPHRTALLVAQVGDPRLAITAEHHDAQTVVGGPAEAVASVQVIARQLSIECMELEDHFALHNADPAEKAAAFAAFVNPIPQNPLNVPVYSPILRGYYQSGEPLGNLLAAHFTRPVAFSAGVRKLYERGNRTFVEAGGGAALSAMLPRALQGVASGEITVLSTLAVESGERLQLPGTLELLQEGGLATGEALRALRLHLSPAAADEEFAAFWAEDGHEIAAYVNRRLRAHHAGRAATNDVTKSAAMASW